MQTVQINFTKCPLLLTKFVNFRLFQYYKTVQSGERPTLLDLTWGRAGPNCFTAPFSQNQFPSPLLPVGTKCITGLSQLDLLHCKIGRTKVQTFDLKMASHNFNFSIQVYVVQKYVLFQKRIIKRFCF